MQQSSFRGWIGLEQLSSSRRSEIGLDVKGFEVKAEEGEGKAWHFFEQRQNFRKLECSGGLMKSREECEN